MKVTIGKLRLHNFKGVASREILFNEILTTIAGRNRSGKTTVVDAFSWLLWGKNSQGITSFNIKTLGPDNEAMHRAEHWVEGELYEDGHRTTFKRVYKEKWQRKTGNVHEEFTGHTTEFFYNNVPLSEKDYIAKVDSIIQEDVFKMLTNPFYFNSLKWESRREAIFQLAQHITDNDIARGNEEFEALLSKNTKLDKLKSEYSAKASLLKTEIKDIPPRVDELTKQNEQLLLDCGVLGDIVQTILNNSERITLIDKLLGDAKIMLEEENKVVLELGRKKNALKGRLETLEFQKKQAYQMALNEQKSAGTQIQARINSAKQLVALREQHIKGLQQEFDTRTNAIAVQNSNLKLYQESYDKNVADFDIENAKKFEQDPNAEFNCPTCKRKLPEDDIDVKLKELEKNFNEATLQRIQVINNQGKNDKRKIEEATAKIQTLTAEQTLMTEKFTVANEQLKLATEELQRIELELQEWNAKQQDPEPFDSEVMKAAPDYVAILDEIKVVEEAEKNRPEELGGNTAELTIERNALNATLDEAKRKKLMHENIDRNNIRINELRDNERNLNQELADLEKNLHVIDQFVDAKIHALEEAINSRFIGVTFKLFKTNVSGTIEKCCETLVNGVPYPDVNRADQINAGLSIINTFSQHHNIYAPVFVDNAEAVNELLPIGSQLVRLVVTTDDQLQVQ